MSSDDGRIEQQLQSCPGCGAPARRVRAVRVASWNNPHENGSVEFACGWHLTDPTTKPFLTKPLSWMKPQHSEGTRPWACREIERLSRTEHGLKP